MAKFTLISRYGNEIVETDSELRAEHLRELGFKNYVKEDKGTTELCDMKQKDLIAYAKANGIDLLGKTKKEDILPIIESALETELD